MMFVDGEGIVSSIIYGPDRRTRMTDKTRNVIFTIYGVPGTRGSPFASTCWTFNATYGSSRPIPRVVDLDS